MFLRKLDGEPSLVLQMVGVSFIDASLASIIHALNPVMILAFGHAFIAGTLLGADDYWSSIPSRAAVGESGGRWIFDFGWADVGCYGRKSKEQWKAQRS